MPLQKRSSDGKLLKFDSVPFVGKLMKECCCALCDPFDPALVDCYKIDGYFDGFLVTCGDSIPSVDPAWPGEFIRQIPGIGCAWNNLFQGPYSVNGGNWFGAQLKLGGEIPDVWWFKVETVTGSGNHIIWSGAKTSGTTPVGTYTRVPDPTIYGLNTYCSVGGSPLPATVDIIPC